MATYNVKIQCDIINIDCDNITFNEKCKNKYQWYAVRLWKYEYAL